MHACDRQTDGRTEFPSLYRVCITCSAVETSWLPVIRLCDEICRVAREVKHGYVITIATVDSQQSAWHDPPGTAPSCSISFITRRQQNVWGNKAMTVCGDGTSTEVWPAVHEALTTWQLHQVTLDPARPVSWIVPVTDINVHLQTSSAFHLHSWNI